MHERERREVEPVGRGGPVRRAPALEHPLLFLQRTAGNAAVSRLIAGMTVQRNDDDEWSEEEAEEAATEAAIEEAALELALGPLGLAVRSAIDIDEYLNPEEYGETAEAERNPEAFPNAPAEGPGEGPEPEW